MKKRAFIRGLWGSHPKTAKKKSDIGRRRDKIDKDIARILEDPKDPPFTMYVFGEENFEKCKEQNMNCVLVDKRPSVFPVYRHKHEIIKIAMEEFDEIIYLDIDCNPVKEIPDNVWDILGKKDVIQAPLISYSRKKNMTPWRGKDEVFNGTIPNGGFVYIRDKSIPVRGIDAWEKTGESINDEIAWAYLTDEMMGIVDKWDDPSTHHMYLDRYWARFEPECVYPQRKYTYRWFREDLAKKKKIIFKH